MAEIRYLSKKLVHKANSDVAVEPWEVLPDPDRRLLDFEENEWDVYGAEDIAEFKVQEQWG